MVMFGRFKKKNQEYPKREREREGGKLFFCIKMGITDLIKVLQIVLNHKPVSSSLISIRLEVDLMILISILREASHFHITKI